MTWSEPKLLGRVDVRTLRALAEVLVPLDSQDVPFGSVDLIARLEAIYEGENPVFLRGTKLSLRLLEYSPWFAGLGPRRFSALSIPERERCVDAWESARSWRLRNLFYTCKALVLSILYDDDAVAAAVGYRS